MLSPKDEDNAATFVQLASSAPISELLLTTVTAFSKKGTGGAIAGKVLLHLLQLKLHRPEDASVGKAVFVVSRDLEDAQLGSGRAAPSHVDRVHKFWTDFRPAAHLWAAHELLLRDAKRTLPTETSPVDEFGTLTDDIVLHAETLLKAAHSNALDFDPNPWTLPEAYPRRGIDIAVPPITDWVINVLREYRAPVRSK
jgi:hypothetical protein